MRFNWLVFILNVKDFTKKTGNKHYNPSSRVGKTADAIGGGVGSLVEQGLNKLFGNQTEIDWVDAGSSMAFGAITGTIEGAGENVGKT